jgi:hypothetical protein
VLFSWLIGATVADERFPFEVSVVVSYFTIVLFVVLSGPFWLARWVSKKRIAKPLAAAEGVREQFTVRHILIWTAVVAGIVSLGRLILGSQAQQNDMPPIGILFMFARFVAIIGLLVAAVGLPMVWAVLTERPSRRVWHLILGICCVAPLVVHELLWVIAGQAPSTEDRVSGLMAWYGFAAAAVLMTGAGLMLARAHGYRLLRIRLRDGESVD